MEKYHAQSQYQTSSSIRFLISVGLLIMICGCDTGYYDEYGNYINRDEQAIDRLGSALLMGGVLDSPDNTPQQNEALRALGYGMSEYQRDQAIRNSGSKVKTYQPQNRTQVSQPAQGESTTLRDALLCSPTFRVYKFKRRQLVEAGGMIIYAPSDGDSDYPFRNIRDVYTAGEKLNIVMLITLPTEQRALVVVIKNIETGEGVSLLDDWEMVKPCVGYSREIGGLIAESGEMVLEFTIDTKRLKEMLGGKNFEVGLYIFDRKDYSQAEIKAMEDDDDMSFLRNPTNRGWFVVNDAQGS